LTETQFTNAIPTIYLVPLMEDQTAGKRKVASQVYETLTQGGLCARSKHPHASDGERAQVQLNHWPFDAPELQETVLMEFICNTMAPIKKTRLRLVDFVFHSALQDSTPINNLQLLNQAGASS